MAKRKLSEEARMGDDSSDEDYESRPRPSPSRSKRPKSGSTARKSTKRNKRKRPDEDDDKDETEDDASLQSDSLVANSREATPESQIARTAAGRAMRAAVAKRTTYQESSESENDDDDGKSAGSEKSDIAEEIQPSHRHVTIKLGSKACQQLKDRYQPDDGAQELTHNMSRRSSRNLLRSGAQLQDSIQSILHPHMAADEPAHEASRPRFGGKTIRETGKKSPGSFEIVPSTAEEPANPEGTNTVQEDASDVEGDQDNSAKVNENELQDIPDPSEEDEGPTRRSLRRQHATPPADTQESPARLSKKLKPKKGDDAGSEYENEGDGSDEDMSGGEPAPEKSNDAHHDHSHGRKRLRQGRARGDGSETDSSSIDLEEVHDEVDELHQDSREKRRLDRRRARKPSVPQLRERAARSRIQPGDYFKYSKEYAEQQAAEEEHNDYTAPSQTRGRRNNANHRTLFATAGPFGGFGGPAPLFGQPHGLAAAGADSDSSDDEVQPQPRGLGSIAGIAPGQPGGLQPATHNADPAQATSGGPANLGKVTNRKALADADPLGVDPEVNFDGVGGLDDHIDRLKEMVALPLLYPEIFLRMHVTPPRGVLFHGPPGTGKTLLARALASSVSAHGQKVTFYMRKGADALSKWVGEAERQLRLLFEEARKNQPSIIFFDEIDGLAPVRSSKQEQIHASIVATLLALMDGMDGRGQVIVIGATNRPDSVDPALRRPGRFDREFYFPLPTQKARRSIIDIHTKGWEPPLEPMFKDKLSELTKGYGGADLRALCTEAALNAVQGTYPQIYSSNKKLLIDPTKIKVLAKDFMLSVNKIIPSSERSAASGAAPLAKSVEPLLRKALADISAQIREVLPPKKRTNALEEAMYDDRDDELGFEKETLAREFESARVFRPRLLIRGRQGMGQQYLGAALLNQFEGLHVSSFDLPNLLRDSTRSAEAAVIQLFEEVKRHKPSVIFIPNVDSWYQTLQDSAIRTFVGLLRSLPPTDPVLVLGMSETSFDGDLPDARMMRDLFGHSKRNTFLLAEPDEAARHEYFRDILAYISRSPAAFPDPMNRKKRELEQLPEAPVTAIKTNAPSKEELRVQNNKDRLTLNQLKQHIYPVMEYIKNRYRIFRKPAIDDNLIEYLYEEQLAGHMSTDLTEVAEQRQAERAFQIAKDDKGVAGLCETSTGKFYYNIEIITIEKRLSNGFYKRPKDFTADIRRLAKDAKMQGDEDRHLRASELLSNVEVDMGSLEINWPALVAECEAVYQRDQERTQKLQASMPAKVVAVPEQTSTAQSQPVDGELVSDVMPPNGLAFLDPFKPLQKDLDETNGHTNGVNGESQLQDVEMVDQIVTSSAIDSQEPVHVQPMNKGDRVMHELAMFQSPPPAKAPFDFQRDHNSTSPSRITNHLGPTITNGYPMQALDFAPLGPPGGSQLPDTQEVPSSSYMSDTELQEPDPTRNTTSDAQGQRVPSTLPLYVAAPVSAVVQQSARKVSDINALLNDDAPIEKNAVVSAKKSSSPVLPGLILADAKSISLLEAQMVRESQGLAVEELEQVMASLMNAVWRTRSAWNRNEARMAVADAFTDTVEDIRSMRLELDGAE